MYSSSVTVRQFQPSAANSILLRAAFSYSSTAELQIRGRMASGYSVRIGIGITATLLLRATRRFDVFVFFSVEFLLLAWGVDDSWLTKVKFPSDGAKEFTDREQHTIEKWNTKHVTMETWNEAQNTQNVKKSLARLVKNIMSCAVDGLKRDTTTLLLSTIWLIEME